MKKIGLCLVLLLVPLPAIAGHEKAAARLGIPLVVGEYLHQFGGMRVTLNRFCAPMMPCKGLVTFYDTGDKSSWVGTATFELNDDGSLGRLLIFQFPDDQVWEYAGNKSAPKRPNPKSPQK
ncbi:MAG: hypothetical protein ACE5MG_07350 [Candidatus Methylomirabilales bacterium]